MTNSGAREQSAIFTFPPLLEPPLLRIGLAVFNNF